MSVPIDDNDSYNDLQLDFSRKNHTFSMDNVGYITKENVDSIGNNNYYCLLTSHYKIIICTSVYNKNYWVLGTLRDDDI